jgi:hypothetical protein
MGEYHAIEGSADLPEQEENKFGGSLSIQIDVLFPPGECEVYCMGHNVATGHEKSLNAI